MKRIAMAVGFLIASLIGGGLAIFGTGGDRVVGLAVVLMFGVSGLAWWMINGGRRRPMPGFQVGQVASAGGNQVAFIARSNRRVLIGGVLACLAFGIGMLLFALAPGGAGDLDGMEAAIMIGGGLFMIGVGLYGAMRLANNSHFALTRRGLHAVGPAGWFVPWDAIVGLDEIEVHGNPFLGIRVADPDAVQMSPVQGMGRWLQRSTMGIDLSIPIRTLTVDPSEFAGAIERYRQHAEHRSRIGASDELELIRSLASPDVSAAPVRKMRRPRSVRRILAIGSLFLIGAFCVLLVASVASDEARPGREFLRLVALIVLSGVALGQLVAAVLLIRNVAAGRTIAIASTVAMLALIVYGLIAGDPDGRPIGLGLLAIIGTQLLLVLIGARAAESRAETAVSIR